MTLDELWVDMGNLRGGGSVLAFPFALCVPG